MANATVADLQKLAQKATFDAAKIRSDFPILQEKMHGKPLVFLDNAASTQKPNVVIDTIANYYRSENANIHRGVYRLSEIASEKYEAVRETVQQFINANSEREVIFTAGTTDSINLVAASFGQAFIKSGDEIIITGMEHHSNIVPWQLLCDRTGAKLRVLPIDENGDLVMEKLPEMINDRTRLISVVYISNSLGTVNPVHEIIDLAHAHDVPVLVDSAQAVQHQSLDVQQLDCDFLAFSGHKIYGPTGVGVLYGKEKWLEKMPPYRGGGDMILTVSFEKTTFNELPYKFEAGTPNIAGVIGLGEAIKYIENIGLPNIAEYEHTLLDYATEQLTSIPELRIIGTAREKSAVISFVVEGVHPHDIGTWADRDGIAVRTGHHCTQPVMDFFEVPATTRASIGVYNNRADFDALVNSLKEMIKVFC
ncbi:MAG: cysteine desulfurase [Calditrichaeota bacterium]|nr:cysteine desulfurase [Calditrichota bacterium]MCB0267364.1 cysteine desulfurase [Calditrichota bacterium]MCB0299192.1 cysteine desulfurase [Calditrichota bacterium]